MFKMTIMAAALCVAGGASLAQSKAELLNNVCILQDEHNQRVCNMYINGVIEGMLFSADYVGITTGSAEGPEEQRLYGREVVSMCIPRGISFGQLQNVAKDYLISHPQDWDGSPGFIIHKALNQVFSCE